MNTSFNSALFLVPSVQQFVNTLTSDLANKRSLVVLLPVGVDPAGIWSALRAELWKRDFEFEEMSLPTLPEGRAPVAALSEVLRVNWKSSDIPRTAANLMATGNLPDIVQLEGLEELPDTARRDWVMFLTQWARISQNMADRGRMPTALCMVVPAVAILPHIPESDVHLAVHWWWGFPSTLEIHLLCRLGNESNAWGIVPRWREHLLPALVGNDVSLVECLWDCLHLNAEDLVDRLYSFAEQRGWEAKALRTWGAEELVVTSNYDHGHQPSPLSAQLRTLWAHGALCWTLEYGLELHTAALAILGRNEELRHRLWRGQAELLLPLIDHMRLKLCDHLTQSYGHDWPVRWHPPASSEEEAAVRNSPLACQWGHLEWLLKNCVHLRSEQRWVSLASLARWIRNEMAHYRPVTFRDFEGFWRKVAQVMPTVP